MPRGRAILVAYQGLVKAIHPKRRLRRRATAATRVTRDLRFVFSQHDEKFAGNGLRTDRPSCVSRAAILLRTHSSPFRLPRRPSPTAGERRAAVGVRRLE